MYNSLTNILNYKLSALHSGNYLIKVISIGVRRPNDCLLYTSDAADEP